MLACYFGLLWYRTRAEENLDRDTTAAAIEVLKEEAFISVSDLLIVFSHMGDAKAPLQKLQYRPDSQLGELLDQFIQGHVFVEDEDEEIDDHQKIEELHKRRNFLASYCKLVVYNVLPTKSAADVLKHYVTFYNDYGDIIKATLGKARENNKTNCAKTMIQSLIYKFNELQQEQGVIERGSEDFHAIKELAKRFSLSFGLDALKNREAVASLHRETSQARQEGCAGLPGQEGHGRSARQQRRRLGSTSHVQEQSRAWRGSRGSCLGCQKAVSTEEKKIGRR